MPMEFPIYRKYSNEKSFFRILSETRFDEVKLTGSRAELFPFEAKIFSDRQLIQDMVNMENDFWQESSMEEFEAVLQKI